MKTLRSNLRPSILTHPDLVRLAYWEEYDAFQAARLEELAPRNAVAEVSAKEMVIDQWRRIRLWGAMAHALETASCDDAFVATIDALYQAEASATRRYLLWRQDFTIDQERPLAR